MREMIFRAWNGKKMYLPEYSEPCDFFIEPDGTISYTEEVGFERHKHVSYHSSQWIIMQFTGLTDINGVKIYENDIVEYETTEGTRHKAPIKWDNDLCCYMVGIMPYPQLYQSAFIQPSKMQFEVIGNIYEDTVLINKVFFDMGYQYQWETIMLDIEETEPISLTEFLKVNLLEENVDWISLEDAQRIIDLQIGESTLVCLNQIKRIA